MVAAYTAEPERSLTKRRNETEVGGDRDAARSDTEEQELPAIP